MLRRHHNKPNLLRVWTRLSPRIRRAGRIALFLDFDGTLSAQRARSGDAAATPAMHRALVRLARHPHIKVYVISGRRRADIRARIRISRIPCLGLHGWERDRTPRPEILKRMHRLRPALESVLSSGRDFWIEDKQFTIVLHFRARAHRRFRFLRRVLRKILVPFGRRIRILESRREWELLPSEIKGKGFAVQSLLRRERALGKTLPIYVGDDASDESAFRILPRGITVRVGDSAPTHARFRLKSPSQVLRFLKKLSKDLP